MTKKSGKNMMSIVLIVKKDGFQMHKYFLSEVLTLTKSKYSIKTAHWVDCPTCDEKKSKNSFTCMKCFRANKRQRNPINNGEKSFKRDTELQKIWKQKIEELMDEQYGTFW